MNNRSTDVDLISTETPTDSTNIIHSPIDITFTKAVSKLLGGLASIPATILHKYVQAINDNTKAKSLVSNALAKKVAKESVNDPLLVKAALEVYIPHEVRKAANRLKVAESAENHLHEEKSTEIPADQSQVPDDDWFNSFMRFAEDASSVRMQDLFGRILAGQIVRPGSFRISSLRILSELDQNLADDFSYAWERSVGGALDFSPNWKLGSDFERWKRLVEVGLLAAMPVKQYLPGTEKATNNFHLWSPMDCDNVWITVVFNSESKAFWEHIPFTTSGREVGSLLNIPNYESNIRSAALRLPKNGLLNITLHNKKSSPEIIWVKD